MIRVTKYLTKSNKFNGKYAIYDGDLLVSMDSKTRIYSLANQLNELNSFKYQNENITVSPTVRSENDSSKHESKSDTSNVRNNETNSRSDSERVPPARKEHKPIPYERIQAWREKNRRECDQLGREAEQHRRNAEQHRRNAEQHKRNAEELKEFLRGFDRRFGTGPGNSEEHGSSNQLPYEFDNQRVSSTGTRLDLSHDRGVNRTIDI